MHKKEITGIIHKISGLNSYSMKVEIIKKFPKLNLKKIQNIKIMIHSEKKLEIGQKIVAVKCAPISKCKHYTFKELK